jgi:hypothetical protein
MDALSIRTKYFTPIPYFGYRIVQISPCLVSVSDSSQKGFSMKVRQNYLTIASVVAFIYGSLLMFRTILISFYFEPTLIKVLYSPVLWVLGLLALSGFYLLYKDSLDSAGRSGFTIVVAVIVLWIMGWIMRELLGTSILHKVMILIYSAGFFLLGISSFRTQSIPRVASLGAMFIAIGNFIYYVDPNPTIITRSIFSAIDSVAVDYLCGLGWILLGASQFVKDKAPVFGSLSIVCLLIGILGALSFGGINLLFIEGMALLSGVISIVTRERYKGVAISGVVLAVVAVVLTGLLLSFFG